jgi:hypothetical protein
MQVDTTFTIATPRLTISHLDPTNNAHCTLIYNLYNAPETVAAKVASPIPTLAAAQAYTEKGATSMQKTGYGRYLIPCAPPLPQTRRANPSAWSAWRSRASLSPPAPPSQT